MPDLPDINTLKTEAAQGDVVAQCKLGNALLQGLGVDKDEKEAVRWYRLAADKGYGGAQCNLGAMLARGLGVDKDQKEAVIWFKRSAEQGYDDAQCSLGIMLAEGLGVDKDEKEAVIWFKRSAELGNAQAQYYLATMLLEGLGVAKNVQEAAKWYQCSADQGFTKAISKLQSMRAPVPQRHDIYIPPSAHPAPSALPAHPAPRAHPAPPAPRALPAHHEVYIPPPAALPAPHELLKAFVSQTNKKIRKEEHSSRWSWSLSGNKIRLSEGLENLLNGSNNFNKEQMDVIYALCAALYQIKRNPVGFLAPHSALAYNKWVTDHRIVLNPDVKVTLDSKTIKSLLQEPRANKLKDFIETKARELQHQPDPAPAPRSAGQ